MINDNPITQMWIVGIFVFSILSILIICGGLMIYSALTGKLINEPRHENSRLNYVVNKFYYHTRGIWGLFLLSAGIAGLFLFFIN